MTVKSWSLDDLAEGDTICFRAIDSGEVVIKLKVEFIDHKQIPEGGLRIAVAKETIGG